MTDERGLVCKWPECGMTRAATSTEFCWRHAADIRKATEAALSEAEHLTDLAAQFEDWCEKNGQPHPYH